MKYRNIQVAIILLLLVSTASATFTKSFDDNSKIVVLRDESGNALTIQEIYTDQSITEFTEIFKISSNYEYKFNPTKDFGLNYYKTSGNQNIYSVQWFILTSKPRFVTEYTVNWDSGNPVNTNPRDILVYDQVWEEYKGGSIKKAETITVKLVIKKKADRVSSILTMPRFGGVSIPELTWWNVSYAYRSLGTITNGKRPYQIMLNISNATGTNNGTYIYTNGSCLAVNCTDIRFVLNDVTELPYWREQNVSNGHSQIWVNLTANGSIYMYYGGTGGDSSKHSGNLTFHFFDDFDGSNYSNNIWYRSSGGPDPGEINVQNSTLYVTAGTGASNEDIISYQPYFNRDTAFDAYTLQSSHGSNNAEFLGIMAWRQDISTSPAGLRDITRLGPANVGNVPYATSSLTSYNVWSISWTTNSQQFYKNYTSLYQDNNTQAATGYTIDLHAYSSQTNSIRWCRVRNYTETNTPTFTAWSNSVYQSTLNLISPANNSITYTTYPPLITTVNFSWVNLTDDIPGVAYEFNIAHDINFNIEFYNTTIYTNSTSRTLSNGDYYWRVRYYDVTNTTYSNYTDIFKFTLDATNVTGSGINGVVYEIISGNIVPISGVSVYITNSTYTNSQIVGSNGYYEFTGLVGGNVYTIHATHPEYTATESFYVTAGNSTLTTRDLVMERLTSPYITSYVYEKISIRDIFDKPYPGVLVQVYDYGTLNLITSGYTSTQGTIVFQLFKNKHYTVTYSGGGIPVSMSEDIYGKEEEHLVTVLVGFPSTPNMAEYVYYYTNVSDKNSTHSTTWFNYTDLYSSTSSITFYTYISNSDGTKTYLCNQVVTAPGTTPQNLSCNVPDNRGNKYIYGINVTSTIWGQFRIADTVTFGGQGDQDNKIVDFQPPGMTSLDNTTWQIICIILLIVIGTTFGARDSHIGAVIIALAAGFMWWIGVLALSSVVIGTVIILAVLNYMRTNEKKVY